MREPSVFNVYGFLGLDVLIQFNPFHFIAEIAAMLAVRTRIACPVLDPAGRRRLEGPDAVARARHGSFEIGFIITITIRVQFDVTLRRGAAIRRCRRSTCSPRWSRRSANLGNWRPRLPEGSNQHVSLRELPDPATSLVLHPFGALEIAQKLVPLDIAIQRFGSRQPSDGQRLHARRRQARRCRRRDDRDRPGAIRPGAVLRR